MPSISPKECIGVSLYQSKKIIDKVSLFISILFNSFFETLCNQSLKAIVSPPPQGPVPVFLVDANRINGGCFADESVFVVATALAAEPAVLDVLSHEAFRVKHQTTILIDAVFLSPNKRIFQRHRLPGQPRPILKLKELRNFSR